MSRGTPWYVKDKWWRSLYAWADEVRKNMPRLPKRCYIRDQTPIEGAYQKGIIFSLDDKMQIVELLVELGVPEVEVGWAGENEEHFAFLRAIADAGLNIVKSAACP